MKVEDYLLKKSVWREKHGNDQYYCPQCRAPRRVGFRMRSTDSYYLFRILLTGLFSTVLTYAWLGWKGMFSVFLYWTIFEVFHRLRKRANLVCDQCGFDPYLYLQDSKLAREEIEAFWRQKFEENGWVYPGDEEDTASAAEAEASSTVDSDSEVDDLLNSPRQL